jgi:DNA-binding Lrp family transcriptional regulator
VSAPSENAQTRFIAALKKDMSVTWLAETGGRYEFMINILASDAAVVRQKLVEWSERYGVTLVTKNLCIRTERMRFCRGYFGPPRSTAPLFHTRAGRGQQQLDTVDVAILTALAAASFESFRELALTCGVPIATFLRRVQRLKERRILLGFGYKLNLSVLHVEQFRLLIRMRQLTSSGHTSLIEFCGHHPNIKLLVVTVGSWDYEIEVDLYPNQSARVLARHIQTALRGAIDSIEICPIFQHLKYISFPPGLVKQ